MLNICIRCRALGKSRFAITDLGWAKWEKAKLGESDHEENRDRSLNYGQPDHQSQLIPFARCSSRTYATINLTSPLVSPSIGGMLPKFQ